jgi:Raf kinase inhibitor-like YbhB/YbcL family protein
MRSIFALACLGAALSAAPVKAQDFTLTSTSIAEGVQLSADQVFQGFGCKGGNISPHLAWSNAPEGTKSFALTAYDPDAPTGSGWWHWNIVNIPVTVNEFAAGSSGSLDNRGIELTNDYGVKGFGGACPPPGAVHRYIFTIYALGIEALDLPVGASNALAGFMINANTIRKASITATYTR